MGPDVVFLRDVTGTSGPDAAGSSVRSCRAALGAACVLRRGVMLLCRRETARCVCGAWCVVSCFGCVVWLLRELHVAVYLPWRVVGLAAALPGQASRVVLESVGLLVLFWRGGHVWVAAVRRVGSHPAAYCWLGFLCVFGRVFVWVTCAGCCSWLKHPGWLGVAVGVSPASPVSYGSSEGRRSQGKRRTGPFVFGAESWWWWWRSVVVGVGGC